MGNMLDENYASPAEEEPEDKDPPEGAEPDAPEPDQAAAPVSRTPITRRQRAKERDESILKELKETREFLAKERETSAERDQRNARELAELRGHVQGLSQSRQEPREREEPAADPGKLLREANAALDAKDFAGYQEKYADYILAKQAADPRFRPAPQERAQPQASPMLQMVASQYVDVLSNPVALTAAKAMDQVYAAQGIPEGPERWKKAFEEGRRYLGNGQQKPATFSQKNREVLSGVPRAGNSQSGEGGGEPGVTLTALERGMAKRFKMSESDYAREMAALHPERIER